MSFWDKASKVAVAVGSGVAEKMKERVAFKQECQEKSADELIRIAKDSGFFGAPEWQRQMAVIELRSRGHGT